MKTLRFFLQIEKSERMLRRGEAEEANKREAEASRFVTILMFRIKL